MENYQLYLDCAEKLKIHLKHEWENLEERLDYLKGEAKTYDSLEKLSKKLISSIVSSASRITNTTKIETRENIYIDNLFATIFEGYLNVLINLKDVKHTNTLDYNSIFESIYSLIANIRAQIKAIDKFLTLISNPITIPDGERIKDDRIEITLNSIKNLSGDNQAEKEKSLKPFLLLRLFGYPTFCVGIISLITAIIVGISIFLDFYALSRQIVYLQRESIELYNQALRELTNNMFLAFETNFLFVIAINLAWICPIVSFIYFIVGRITYSKIKSKTELSSEQKYFLSFMHIDKGIFIFKYNLEKHKLLIIESAEEGNINANIRLGDLYRTGKFEKKGLFAKPSKQSLAQALKSYERAFPDKTAVKKYEKLEKRIMVK